MAWERAENAGQTLALDGGEELVMPAVVWAEVLAAHRLDSPTILSILPPMTVVAEKLRTELTKLDDAERGELAHFLIQSLDPSCDEDAESAWDVELERRADEIRNGQAIGVPADKVFSEILAKHS